MPPLMAVAPLVPAGAGLQLGRVGGLQPAGVPVQLGGQRWWRSPVVPGGVLAAAGGRLSRRGGGIVGQVPPLAVDADRHREVIAQQWFGDAAVDQLAYLLNGEALGRERCGVLPAGVGVGAGRDTGSVQGRRRVGVELAGGSVAGWARARAGPGLGIPVGRSVVGHRLRDFLDAVREGGAPVDGRRGFGAPSRSGRRRWCPGCR